jgi:hypothetical protein
VIPFGTDTLSFQADWTFRAHTYTEFNQSLSTAREIPKSDNLSAAITYAMKQWEIGLFGQNLTNGTRIILVSPNAFPDFQPGDAVTWARPRTVGVRAKMMF